MDSSENLEPSGQVEKSVDGATICENEKSSKCSPDDISTSLSEKLVLNDNPVVGEVTAVPIKSISEDKENVYDVSSNIQATDRYEQTTSKEVSTMNLNDTSIEVRNEDVDSIGDNNSKDICDTNYEQSEDGADGGKDKHADDEIEDEREEEDEISGKKIEETVDEHIDDEIDDKQSDKLCGEEVKETIAGIEQSEIICGEKVKETVDNGIKELEYDNKLANNIECVELLDDKLEEGEIRDLEDDEINKKHVDDILSIQHDDEIDKKHVDDILSIQHDDDDDETEDKQTAEIEDKQNVEVEDRQTDVEIKQNDEMSNIQVDELEDGEIQDEEISDSDIKRKRQWGTEFESDENDDSGKSIADDEEDEYTDAEEEYSSEEGEDKKERSEDDERQTEEKHFSEEPEKPKVEKQTKEEEDRRDPAYVPRKGMFFEHDMRAGTDDENKEEPEKTKKKSRADDSRWKHDKFDEFQQAPKKTHEIVRCYGYDIRREGQRQDRKYRPKKQSARTHSERIPSESSPQRNQMSKQTDENKENDYIKEQNERTTSELEKHYRRRPQREEHEFNYNHSRNEKRVFTRTEIITTHGGTENIERFEEQRYRADGRGQEQRHKVEGRGQEQRHKVEGRSQEQRPRVEERNQEQRLRVEERSEKPRVYAEERRRNQISNNYRKDNYVDRRRVNNYSKDMDSHESSQDARRRYGSNENYANEWRTDGRRGQQQGFGNRRGEVRKSYGYRRDVEEDFRSEQNRRPPRMQRVTSDRSPRDMEVVNSNSQVRPRMQHSRDNETEQSDIHIEITNSKFKDEVPKRMDSPPLTTAGKSAESQSSEPISRKGWAGGEFTPSWKVQQQQDKFPLQEKDEEVNTGTKSKRYSSSRQQQQPQLVPKQPLYVETEYMPQMTHYRSTAAPGPVYEPGHHAVIQHQGLHAAAYAPLVTVPYPTYYSTHPGNVYPSPSPVYQHTQTTHPYTIPSYAQHLPNSPQIAAIPQIPEGAIYYGTQGVAHPGFYDATPSSRAKSAIPIVNPQDLTNQNRAKRPEAVAIHGQ